MHHIRDLLHVFWRNSRMYIRGLALAFTTAPLTASAYVACTILFNLLPVLQVWLAKLFIDMLAALLGTSVHASAAGGTLLILPVALYALTLIVSAGLEPVQSGLVSSLNDRVVAEVDRRTMQAATRLVDLKRIESAAFHDEVHRIQQASSSIQTMLWSWSYGQGRIITLLGLLFLLARLQPLLPLALIIASVLSARAQVTSERRKYQSMVKYTRMAREMDYSTRVTTDRAVAHEVRIFQLGNFFLQRFRERRDRTLAEVRRLRVRELGQGAVFAGLTALVIAGAFWDIASQAASGHMTLGDIALYLGATMQAQECVLFVAGWSSNLYRIALNLSTLFDFVDGAQPSIELPPAGQGLQAPSASQTGIELLRVRFRYPEAGQAEDVLKEGNGLLPAGKVTALVGVNGAGKSTLVKLLTRMYDPAGGKILLDGHPLAGYDLAAMRQRMAVVYQDFAHFALTLGENIAVDDAYVEDNVERVEQAACWSGADEVASKLPQGYDTQLTRKFEGGVELSGGEWQKVALARGFMRDAALIILDEPASALDADAEYQLFQRFRALISGKTALLISHRLSTVRMADHILVLDDGRIIEAGSHEALLELGGHYAALYEMQAGRYR